MINVGIIGCGKIALTRHLPEYSQRQDCRVAAVYDPNIERAKIPLQFIMQKSAPLLKNCFIFQIFMLSVYVPLMYSTLR